MIGRYYRTKENFVAKLMKVRERVDKGHLRGYFSQRFLSRIKREAVNNPVQRNDHK